MEEVLYGYARFVVIVYMATRPGLPVRPTLNYFDWCAAEAKEPLVTVDQTMPSGYHRHEVITYSCKLGTGKTVADPEYALTA